MADLKIRINGKESDQKPVFYTEKNNKVEAHGTDVGDSTEFGKISLTGHVCELVGSSVHGKHQVSRDFTVQSDGPQRPTDTDEDMTVTTTTPTAQVGPFPTTQAAP